MPGVPNASPAVDVTILFREIKLYSADYFTGVAGGPVAGSRSRWAKLAGAQQGSGQVLPRPSQDHPPLTGSARHTATGGREESERIQE
ncbi:MAG: hypothetical protein R2758_17335 [Bacteroidales bacterium]